MAFTWENIVEKYNYIINDLSHPLTKDMLLIPSPWPILSILIIYNVVCIKIGPMLMKHKRPYKLERVMKLYNICQIVVCIYLVYEGYLYLFSGKFNFQCQEISEGEQRIVRGAYIYFLTKLFDLLDTVFFVLRKSNRQITFLHVFHHTLMPINVWIGVKYFPGGQGVLMGTINCIVHVFMYTYYLLSGLGPQYQKYLWWKKYITVIQIAQFLIIALHSFNSLFYSCGFLTTCKVLILINSCIFLYMFSKFYYLTYIVNKNNNSHNVNHDSTCEVTTSDNNETDENCIKNRKTVINAHDVNGDLNIKSSSEKENVNECGCNSASEKKKL